VPRSNRRNFLNLFRAVEVDDAELGPAVSDNIQLVYIADDLRQTNYIYGGAGGQEGAVIGEHGIIRLECRTRGGLEVQQVTASVLVPVNGVLVILWTSRTEPAITGPAVLNNPLRTDRLGGAVAGPQGLTTRGTIASAAIPADAFRMIDQSGFAMPMFLANGQGINIVFGAANTAVHLGVAWRELRLYG